MQPIHNCSQDCETLHKEISKKLLLIILGSRSSQVQNNLSKTNNWFGLETPFGGGDLLQGHEEEVKSLFGASQTAKELKVSVYLDNEEGILGIEDEWEGKVRKEAARKGKLLLEIWSIRFHPKCIASEGEEEIRKLYKLTTLFVRSLFTITRLLPVYSLVKQKLPIHLEILHKNEHEQENRERELSESLLSTSNSSEAFESVNETELSRLQTNHGDVQVSVRFKKLPQAVKFYTIVRSPAIRVPQQVIKAKDIQIKSSPVTGGSGDWIDMTQQQQVLSYKQQQQQHIQQQKRFQSNPQTPTINTNTGQIKILTTAHKPSSSLVPESRKQQRTDLSDFIKTFEKVPPTETVNTSTSMSPSQLIQILETGRSKKIHFDRWLEELEIEHEQQMIKIREFDLVDNME